jgi:hypothetical protein
MSKRRLQFGIKALVVLGGAAALLLWVGGSMGGAVLASAQESGGATAGEEQANDETTEATADSLESGYDSWVTPDSGKTKLDLPFPAGFFCNGLSSAVTKTIKFKGVPFTTNPGGEIGEADTLIERMDTATFVNGVATTRLRIVGLSLASSAPITITCPNGTTESWSARNPAMSATARSVSPR